MSREKIFKDFDLPTNHLPGNQHFVPPKARSSEEIERRRSLQPGTLLAEHQVKGLWTAKRVLETIEEPEDIAFSAKVIAVSGLNSAWYSFARGSEEEVMRRRLKLPWLATGSLERRPDTLDLLPEARDGLHEAVIHAHLLVGANEHVPSKVPRQKTLVGRRLGGTSLALSCVASLDGFERYGVTVTDADAQNFARQRGLWALHHARTLSSRIGSYPSIAQLADPDSDLSVFWRRNAPNGALEALESALSDPLVV